MAIPSTIVSATLEQSILETLAKASIKRDSFALDNPGADLQGLTITQSVNLAAKRVVFQVTLPITVSIDTDGGQSFDVVPVLA